MRKADNICILAVGSWEPKCVKIRQVANLSNITQDDVICEIADKWKDFKKSVGNEAKDNPTICYLGHKQTQDKLLLNVVSSSYKSGLVLGYLGCAMIPVTSDKHIVLVEPAPGRAERFGEGIASSGCTPHCIQVIEHACIEMKEEFGASVEEDDLRILGLTQIYDAELQPNHCLVVKVTSRHDRHVFKELWEGAKDRNEANALHFIPLDDKRGKILLSQVDVTYSDINPHTFVHLEMFAKGEGNAGPDYFE
jgi:hypothetical protein